MTVPNFLGIGVERAGTTWLYNCLKEHPEVYVPEEIKEIGYFTYRYSKGPEWYQEFFRDVKDEQAIGEFTPGYIQREGVDRIASDLPEAKLILILREPLSRSFSAYQLYNETLGNLSFPEACLAMPGLVEGSMYFDRIQYLFSKIRRENIQVLLYDNLRSQPQVFLSQVFQFLGVDPSFQPGSLGKVYNHIMYPKTQRLLERLHLKFIVEGIKKTPVGEYIKSRGRNKIVKKVQGIPDDFKQELNEKFAQDIQKVQALLELDLSQWLLNK